MFNLSSLMSSLGGRGSGNGAVRGCPTRSVWMCQRGFHSSPVVNALFGVKRKKLLHITGKAGKRKRPDQMWAHPYYMPKGPKSRAWSLIPKPEDMDREKEELRQLKSEFDLKQELKDRTLERMEKGKISKRDEVTLAALEVAKQKKLEFEEQNVKQIKREKDNKPVKKEFTKEYRLEEQRKRKRIRKKK